MVDVQLKPILHVAAVEPPPTLARSHELGLRGPNPVHSGLANDGVDMVDGYTEQYFYWVSAYDPQHVRRQPNTIHVRIPRLGQQGDPVDGPSLGFRKGGTA